MRKKLLNSIRVLLVAAGLCVGATNAWADKEYTQVWSNDFEDAETYTAGITLTKSRSQATSTVAQYARTDITSKAYSLYASAYNTVVTYNFTDDYFASDDYQFCMDFALQVPRNYSSAECNVKFQIFDNSDNELFKVYLASVNDPGSGSSTLFDAGIYINGSSTAESEVVKVNTFRGGTVSFYKITITSNATDGTSLTLSKYDTSTGVLSDMKTYNISASRIQLGKVVADPTGYNQTGYGKIWLDNFTLGIYSDTEVVNSPTIGSPVYAGANRTVEITAGTSSKSNTVTTYYTVNGTDPSSSNYEGYFTEASKIITITSTCTLKAISISSEDVSSPVVSRAITAGMLTLNAPKVTLSSMNASGSVYNPTFTFTSDQSSVMGTPVATLSYSFAGGTLTEASTYDATTAGTLVVTASADGYTSASTEITVKVGYVLTNSIDVKDLYNVSGLSASNGFYSGLSYDLIPNVAISRTDDTKGAVYRGTHSTTYNAYYARNAAFTATCSNLSENEVVVFADYTGAAYTPCTSTSNVTTVAKDGTLKYYYLYTQPTLTQSITVSDAEWKTLVSPYSLDFTSVDGLKAYIVTGGADGVLTKTQVTKVPAGTALLLNGSATTYSIPVIAKASATDDVSGNKLVGVVTSKEIAAEAGYVLMASPSLGFYLNTNAFTLGAFTAYLPAGFDSANARSFFALFGDDTTDINTVQNAENVLRNYYNLSGQRVAQPTKGLYIVNGKKVVVK